jgi:hypothetical protein
MTLRCVCGYALAISEGEENPNKKHSDMGLILVIGKKSHRNWSETLSAGVQWASVSVVAAGRH